MRSAVTTGPRLRAIEHELAGAPVFGAPVPLRRKVVDLLRFIGEVVGLPDDVDDATVLAPMTRVALNGALNALRSHTTPPALTGVVFEALRASPRLVGPLLRVAVADAVPYWIPDVDDPIAAAFARFVEAQLAETGLPGAARPVPPDAEVRRVLDSGIELLRAVLPEVTASAFAHCSLLVLMDPTDAARDGLFESASFDELPGVLFLSPAALGSVEQAAEALLHEALHQKLTDLRQTADLVRPGYDSTTADTIVAPWTATRTWNSALWDVDRALAACHVYVHLALLHRRLDPTGPRAALTQERALYLADELCQQDGPDLRRGGRDLARWLRSQATALDRSS